MTDDRRVNEGDEQSPAEGTDVAVEAEAGTEPAGGAEAEAPAAEPDPGEADESTAQLSALQAEMQSLNDRHLRLAAEFDNYRKRVERERMELRVRAQAELAGKLLEALDDLQRVVHFEPKEEAGPEAILEAAAMVEKKLRHALESAGLEPIDAEGEFFNPATMEALMTVPAERPEEDEMVADVFQKGYRFADVLIRPARVRVKKHEA